MPQPTVIQLKEIRYLADRDNIGRDLEIEVTVNEIVGPRRRRRALSSPAPWRIKLAHGKTHQFSPPKTLLDRQLFGLGPAQIEIHVRMQEIEVKPENNDVGESRTLVQVTRGLMPPRTETLLVPVIGVAGDRAGGRQEIGLFQLVFEISAWDKKKDAKLAKNAADSVKRKRGAQLPGGALKSRADLVAIMSDFHIGAGDVGDDFDQDDQEAFQRAIDWLLATATTKKKIDLVLLGDVFDFWAVPDFITPVGTPLIVTPERASNGTGQGGRKKSPKKVTAADARKLAMDKIDRIADVHQVFFATLVRFQAKGHRVVYTLGNHDDDLIDKEVQRHLINATKVKFDFRNVYSQPELSLRALHGHQFDDEHRTTGFGKKSPGRDVTERLWQTIETYHAHIDAAGGATEMRRPFNGVDAAQAYASYLRCLRQQGKLPQHLAEVVLDQLDDVVSQTKDRFALTVLRTIGGLTEFMKLPEFILPPWNPALFQPDQDAIDEILTVLDSASAGANSQLDEVPKLFTNDYRCIVMGHTHVAQKKEFSDDRLYVNAGNWQDSAVLDPQSPTCLRPAPHRQLTLFFRDAGAEAQEAEAAKTGKRGNPRAAGRQPVFVRQYTFPEAELSWTAQYTTGPLS